MLVSSLRSIVFHFSIFASLLGLGGCDLFERAGQLVSGEKSEIRLSAPSTPEEQALDESANEVQHSPPAPSASVPALASPPNGAPQSFADLASSSDAGVVFVRTVQRARRGFRRVLDESSGSGFVFNANGMVLTNHHVVSGAEAIMVEFKDGRGLIAKVIAQDRLTDLAILKVEAQGLAALPLGDSDQVRVGDWVIAIGNPYGLEHTVSAGIISAKERTGRDVKLGNPDAYYSFLQTDASINPGNSGGPLLDLGGRVVGINTAINPGANSIGFAIPINMIKRLLPRMLRDGMVKRAAIGVEVTDIISEDVARFQLPNRRGAFIMRVLAQGPAARAGVLPGDVVVSFDGHSIESPEQFRWNASLAPVGQEVPLTVIRGGKTKTLTIRPAPLRSR